MEDGKNFGKLTEDYRINVQFDFKNMESPGAAFTKIIRTWDRYRNY
jgi:hypothetical protein